MTRPVRSSDPTDPTLADSNPEAALAHSSLPGSDLAGPDLAGFSLVGPDTALTRGGALPDDPTPSHADPADAPSPQRDEAPGHRRSSMDAPGRATPAHSRRQGPPTERFAVLQHITDRDRHILNILDQHKALTTDQMERAFFTGARRCQLRLRDLHRWELLDRFRFANPRYGMGQRRWTWTLGPVGARFQAAVTGRRAPTDRAHHDRVLRLSTDPALNHLLTVNEFFVQLIHHSHGPGRATGARLDRWWSERDATASFLGIHPDGHLLWTARGRTVGAFVEVDLGTENLARVARKLIDYARQAASGGPRYPVLFWLPNRQREINLRRYLTAVFDTHHPADPTRLAGWGDVADLADLADLADVGGLAGSGVLPVPVATAIHSDDPAGPVWLPVDAWRRVELSDLPSDHGPRTAQNPNWRAGQLDLT